jgi:hypothetical protein
MPPTQVYFFSQMEKPHSKEGHGFSRAIKCHCHSGLWPCGTAFSWFSAKTLEENRTSAAEAAGHIKLPWHG